ncbi:MAG: sulfurtransferase-like selenium metabolism protein YedF [Deltaproteobacteria bacterium]|nr:sulfurtransferase-like selenium metabolism protein YedF [Deltaproteobacteria bacterium]
MAEKYLDCRGLACPNPVLKTKELIDQGDVAKLTVLVDNPAAKENVGRFLNRAGFEVQVAEEAGGFAVTGRRGVILSGAEKAETREQAAQKILVLIGTDRVGTGDDVLGRRLMASFVSTLKEMGRELWCVVLLNAGVKLAAAGSEILGGLKELEKEGVMILVCGTCLNHFQLLEQKQVGETTNMLDIVTHMQLADKVISLT